MKKKQATEMSNWFWDMFMKNPSGIVSIDDFSRKFTETKYKKAQSTDQYLTALKTDAKTDTKAFDQLCAYARYGYLQRLLHKLVTPVRHYYEHEKDEQGNPSRLIYSVRRNGTRGWTFINLKDLDFWNQTAFKNMDMKDAYTDNEKRMFEQAWQQLKLAKNDKEREIAMKAIEVFTKRGRRYQFEKD